jgi:hypothetical protein
MCDRILANPHSGPIVVTEELLDFEEETPCADNLSWFQESLQKIVLRPGIIVGGNETTMETFGHLGMETIGNFGIYRMSQQDVQAAFDDDFDDYTVSAIKCG